MQYTSLLFHDSTFVTPPRRDSSAVTECATHECNQDVLQTSADAYIQSNAWIPMSVFHPQHNQFTNTATSQLLKQDSPARWLPSVIQRLKASANALSFRTVTKPGSQLIQSTLQLVK